VTAFRDIEGRRASAPQQRKIARTREGSVSGVHLVGSVGLAAFGVATECGMARADSEAMARALLKIHADVCGDA
jgi:hypothetical protein